MRTLVGADTGAAHQTQLYLEVRDQPSPALAPREPTQTIIFVAGRQRHGRDRQPAIQGRSAGWRDGAAPVRDSGCWPMQASPCRRSCRSVRWRAWNRSLRCRPSTTHNQLRVACIDEQQRKAMGTRFFQHLVDGRLGAQNAVQFIGHIPQSKAKMHRHLYEEAVIIVSGEGVIWNENVRASVAPGDVIFFPRKHVHSLQCTSPDGMDVLGVIHPGDNPGINY
jgi:quercetin dioxygenase-like cupin family protein